MNFLKSLIPALFILFFSEAQSQHFEGKLTYLVSYEIKNDAPNTYYLKNRNNDKMEYYISNGRYKTILKSNDTIKEVKLYLPEENRLYSYGYLSDYITWSDCSYADEEIKSIDKKDGFFNILGRNCRQLTFKYEDSKTTYFYMEDYQVDPASFSQHKMNHWKEYLDQTNGSLSAKIVEEYENYVKIMTLISISEESLDSSIWKIDSDKETTPHIREITQMAEVKGGMRELYKRISKTLMYPAEARKMNIQGKVFVQFLVNEDGSVSNFKVVKGVFPPLDDEAKKVLEKCANEVEWEPSYMNDIPVKTPMILPITFKLG